MTAQHSKILEKVVPQNWKVQLLKLSVRTLYTDSDESKEELSATSDYSSGT